MNTSTLTAAYAVALHLLGLAALTVLTALGKLDPTTGVSLIAGLLGLGVGAGVQLNTQAATVTPPAPAPPAVPHA